MNGWEIRNNSVLIRIMGVEGGRERGGLVVVLYLFFLFFFVHEPKEKLGYIIEKEGDKFTLKKGKMGKRERGLGGG